MKRTTLAAAAIALSLPLGVAQAAGMSDNGMSDNGMTDNGMTSNGMTDNGMSSMSDNGMTSNGMTSNAMSSNSMSMHHMHHRHHKHMMAHNSMSEGTGMPEDNRMSSNDMSGNSMSSDNWYSPKTSDAGVRYAVGGVGKESEKTMKKHAGEYSLHVLTVSGKAYVSDVNVKIATTGGKTELDTSANGPMLYADLKPGTYKVTGTLDGKSDSQTVKIHGKGSKTVHLNFPNAQQ